jgi:hypothetical protein
MALVALIAASEMLADGDLLRALAPVAGETIVERQAARALDAGAETIFVVVASVPPLLSQALDRVRRRGAPVQMVRDAADMQSALQPTDRVLLVADGLVAPASHYKALATGSAPALLVTADTPLTQALERVDAAHRWGGLALVPASSVSELAALPGEWDMVLTLLRFAIQSGGSRLECEPALFGQGEISVVSDSATASQMERVGIQQVEYGGLGMGRSLITMPLVRLIGPALVRSPRAIAAMPWLTGLAWMAAASSIALGHVVAAAVAGVLGSAGLSALRFMAAFRIENPGLERLRMLFRTGSVVLLAALPWAATLVSARPSAPPLAEVALGLCLAATILLARWLYGELASGRRYHWLLPDGDQAWLALLISAPLGLATPAMAALPLAGLFQTLVWLRLAKRGDMKNGQTQ